MQCSPALHSLRPPQPENSLRIIWFESRRETGPENWQDLWFVDGEDDEPLDGYLFSDDVER